jgi:hypothetical protein
MAKPDDHTRAATQPTTTAMTRLLEDHSHGAPHHQVTVTTRAEYTGPGQRYILHADLLADDGYRIHLKYESEPGRRLLLVPALSGHRPGISLTTPGGPRNLPYHHVRRTSNGRPFHAWAQRADDVAKSLRTARRVDQALARALAGDPGPDYRWQRPGQPDLIIRAGMRVQIPPSGPDGQARAGRIAFIRHIVVRGHGALDIDLVADDSGHFSHAAAGSPAVAS